LQLIALDVPILVVRVALFVVQHITGLTAGCVGRACTRFDRRVSCRGYVSYVDHLAAQQILPVQCIAAAAIGLGVSTCQPWPLHAVHMSICNLQ
jgi:hypothetical protein